MQKNYLFIAVIIIIPTIFVFVFLGGQQRSELIKNESVLQQERLVTIEENQVPSINTLYIPSLSITADISEGEYESDRDYLKTWRRTHTNTPDKGGNTVIVGHRYKDKPEYPLFNIDQISEGDVLTVYWDGIEYNYEVYNALEVGPTDISIEDPSDEDILTLYACDWSGNTRLVVQARPIE